MKITFKFEITVSKSKKKRPAGPKPKRDESKTTVIINQVRK